MNNKKYKYAWNRATDSVVYGELEWVDGVGIFLELDGRRVLTIPSDEVAVDNPEDAQYAWRLYAENRIKAHEETLRKLTQFHNRQIQYYTDMIRDLYKQ